MVERTGRPTSFINEQKVECDQCKGPFNTGATYETWRGERCLGLFCSSDCESDFIRKLDAVSASGGAK